MMNYGRKFLAVVLTTGILAVTFPAFAATPQAIDSPAFLAQVASVLDTIQKTLHALAAAIQSIADGDASENAAATPFPTPSPTFVTPSPTPYSPPSTLSVPVPPPLAPAQLTADEILLEQLKTTFKQLQERVAAQKAAPTPAPQLQFAPTVPRLNAPAAGSPRFVTTAAGTFTNAYERGDPTAPKEPRYAKDTIIVKFKDTAGEIAFRKEGNRVIASKPSITQLLDRHRVSDVKKLVPHRTGPLAKIFVVKVPAVSVDSDILAVVDDFAKDSNAEYAEPNYFAYTLAERPKPNDPLYSQQWHLPKVSAPNAWLVTPGSPNVVIAVIDTGVKWNHPDLAANIWRNAGEIPNNDIDDDRNGYIDDDKGWDFVETSDPNCWTGEDCTIEDNNPDDFHGHGTHVSGVAAAVTNNGVGVAGMCQRCKIMPVRAGYAVRVSPLPYPLGGLEYDDIIQAISYAADNGAKIISMSFSGSAAQALQDAIRYAAGRGAILVAAAGNGGAQTLDYPARYSETISVSATDRNDQKANFSNYGPWVDVAAPGVDIWSTLPPGRQLSPTCWDSDGDGYDDCSGTSMATPLTAGVVGLAVANNPNLNRDQVKTLMRSSVDPLTIPGYVGTGRINAFKAVQSTAVPIASMDPSFDNAYVSSSVSIMGTAAGATFSRYRVEFGRGIYPTLWTTIRGDTLTPVTNGVLAVWDPRALNVPSGEYTIKLTLTDTSNRVWIDTTTVRVDVTLVPGWPRVLPESTEFQFPTLVDVDGNGDGEILIQTRPTSPVHESFYILDHSGLPYPGWPIPVTNGTRGTNLFSPAAADVDNDRMIEVVFGTLVPTAPPQPSQAFLYGRDGQLEQGWPISVIPNVEYIGGGGGSPVIANLDGGNDLEIIIPTRNGPLDCGTPGNTVYVFKPDGRRLAGWPQQIPTPSCPLLGTPAVGDIDANGDLEIVVPTSDWVQDRNGPLYIFNHDGTMYPGWPRQNVAAYGVSPVLADLDRNDGGRLEIIAGGGSRLSVLNHDGTTVPGFPLQLDSEVRSPIAIGDIDGNGDPEIVLATNFGDVYAVHHDGTMVSGWPIHTQITLNGAPIIVDLDGDGRMEIIIGSNWTTALYGFRADGAPIPNFPKPLMAPTIGPVAGDLNGNGLVDIFTVDYLGNMYLWEFSGPARPQAFEWPQFHHDAQHTGRHEPYIPQQ